MKYRRESSDGDYTFGQGDRTWLSNSPEAVAQAVTTRMALWYGQWFLDTTAGMPWREAVLGKRKSDAYSMVLRRYILETQGVNSLADFSLAHDASRRRLTVTATLNTHYGQSIVTTEA